MRVRVGAVIAFAASAVIAGCGQTAAPKSGDAASDDHTPPVVVLGGKDLNVGSGVSSASSECKDNPSIRAGNAVIRKVMAWRGISSGQQPVKVSLMFVHVKDQDETFMEIDLANGEVYKNEWKDTKIAVSGLAGGWYKFSGKLTGKDAHYDSPRIDVEGSIACANYGAPIFLDKPSN